MKIVCVEGLGIDATQFEQLKEHYISLGHTFEYYLDRKEDEATLLERMHDADIVAISNIPLPSSVLKGCINLKYISVAFTGLDHIDLQYCQSKGIVVQNAAGYSTTAVSELAVGMMIDLMRRVSLFNVDIRQGATRNGYVGTELRGKKVGIIGTGAIGMATAKLLLAFGCEVIAYSRSHRQEVEEMGIRYTSLEDLLHQSDIVSLHVPLTESTHHLIDKEQLRRMKPSSLLINTARGNVCNIDAVAEALNNGVIAGAAFDVFEHEPPISIDHPLLQCKNCLCTPHIAFATKESFAARAIIVFDHIDKFLL